MENKTQINIKKEYSLFHHELLDRLYCVMQTYNTLIVDHMNDEEILSAEEKDQMSLVLGDLYQMVGDRICKLYGGENNVCE